MTLCEMKWVMGILSLPSGYSELREINLQSEKKMMMFVNLGVVVIMATLFLAGIAITPLRFGSFLWRIASCFGVVLYLLAHELLHSIAIRIFSGSRAKHKFTGLYVLTGSDSYFTKRQYRVIAFAPVILFGIALLSLQVILPGVWFWRIYFIQIANISMSFGDIFIAGFLLGKYDSDVLIKGEGVSITIYARKQ